MLYHVSYLVAACYLLVGLVLTALREAHREERAATSRRPDRAGSRSEPSIEQQRTRLRHILDDLQQRLPAPAEPGDKRAATPPTRPATRR
ncbi:hypothetical protein [Actinoplanes teichomyceticus]|uniref:Uncharacterized protein n=1 Tax=Actinoplanes teichomyceticus TaxID=1867 RepID=A0A561WKB3_ACTTI|nr:hypothetical protein [Actinoplanes teichomyceticus]TWG24306.1 hypothetical protein FHX34_102859 [Actinoplanes teichomyceticus]GIF12845.1 hypothetical protein Ate01nite_28770 [Actinoplanes teichomyceticus]